MDEQCVKWLATFLGKSQESVRRAGFSSTERSGLHSLLEYVSEHPGVIFFSFVS